MGLLHSVMKTINKEVVRISRIESARIAAANPGPGVPLSKLPVDAKADLIRNGLTKPLRDLIESSK